MDTRNQSQIQTLARIGELTQCINDAWIDMSADFCERGHAYLDLAIAAADAGDKKTWLRSALSDAQSAVDAAWTTETKIKAYLLRGLVNHHLNAFDKVISDFDEVLFEIDVRTHKFPIEVACAYHYLGYAFFKLGNTAKSIECYLTVALDYGYTVYGQTDYLKSVLFDIMPHHDLSKLEKETLFAAIKTLAPEDQLPLLKNCLDPETGLGMRMWKSENSLIGALGMFNYTPDDFVSLQCDYGKGMLKAIEDHLVSIDPAHVRNKPLHKIASVKQVSDLNNDGNERYDSLYSL